VTDLRGISYIGGNSLENIVTLKRTQAHQFVTKITKQQKSKTALKTNSNP